MDKYDVLNDTKINKKFLLKSKFKSTKSQKFIKLIENKKNVTQYNLTESQVTAILELRLQKLTALGINEIDLEINKLSELIIQYKKVLSSKKE